jgi:hypothetical protein
MISYFTQADPDYGRRVTEELKACDMKMKAMKSNPPAPMKSPVAAK